MSIYFPLLRVQRGECDAIKELSPGVRENVYPTWELTQIPQRSVRDGGGDKITLEEHLKNTFEKLMLTTLNGQALAVDVSLYDTVFESDAGDLVHTITYLNNLCTRHNIQLEPVVTDTSSDDLIQAIVDCKCKSVCIRVNADDREYKAIKSENNRLYKALGLEQAQIRLIFDLKGVNEKNFSKRQSSIVSLLQNMTSLEGWKNTSIASSSYRDSMSGAEKHKVLREPLLEVQLWKNLSSLNIVASPNYGDYCLSAATLSYDTPVEFMNPSATIRYSSPLHWIYVKGEQVKGRGGKKGAGWSQTQALCKILIDTVEYRSFGNKYSWGDKHISDRSENKVSSGTGSTWRQAGVNHHATMIVKHLSNQSEI
ncbi:hypothetical protein AL542_11870 [Grimontia hollisae]|uniref:Uncharacterized protein n=1 Tax=Grimontia hollisae CIP 101886 TaxID=675812 RepID=D0I8D0_GRIHO|nr:beta family protein [Grimontia hollisae]AMG30985.1 hypothetical protein AL542_11870 [Grimontia hollisae]EEY72899.1 hypothetical protein VHA_002005 [Grimontia hollisae CIP 101886]STO46953.1 Uncharacterised protein [Grimontia hollisae]